MKKKLVHTLHVQKIILVDEPNVLPLEYKHEVEEVMTPSSSIKWLCNHAGSQEYKP